MLILDPLVLQHPHFPVYVREFGIGAKKSSNGNGISVIIDNYRASNTILALLEAGAKVTPVLSVEEALQYEDYIKVGEKGGKRYSLFDYDNSPFEITQNAKKFKNRHVVIRTTNGTRGIVQANGSREILVGAFRNLSAVVDYCYSFALEDISISFIAMGSLDIPRIEDRYGAKMMFYKLMEKLPITPQTEEMLTSDDNPWNRDWKQDIIDDRGLNENNRDDRMYALNLDITELIPKYDPEKHELIAIRP